MKTVYFFTLDGAILNRGGGMDGLLPESDTISAALMSLWRSVDARADIALLAKNPPFKVASAMPWVRGSKGMELLYPIPPDLLSVETSWPGIDRKTLKRTAFVDGKLLSILVKNESPPEELGIWDRGRILTSFTGNGIYSNKGRRMRLTVDRLSGGAVEGLLFESEEHRIHSHHGIAVVADFDASNQQIFEAVLKLLSLEGIGSKRSLGFGKMSFIEKGAMAPPDIGRGAHLLLSMYYPTKSEVQQGALNGCYSLSERTGWIGERYGTPLRRGRVRMLTPGSIIPGLPDKPEGNIVEVQPPLPQYGLLHPVFRDGRAFTIPIASERVR